MIFILGSMIYAQAQNNAVNTKLNVITYGSGSGTMSGNYNPKGTLPPQWLKNKVSAAQYNSLSILNMLADVDYTAFKGIGKCEKSIKNAMGFVNKAILQFVNDTPDNSNHHFSSAQLNAEDAKPLKETAIKNGKQLQYIFYSSIDGYDAHVLLSATAVKDKKQNSYTAQDLRIEGYSLSGLPVTIKLNLINCETFQPANTIEIGKDGRSGQYRLEGTIEFDDPLGNHHTEHMNLSRCLTL